jgi:ligand-binding sensor domain-containing protein
LILSPDFLAMLSSALFSPSRSSSLSSSRFTVVVALAVQFLCVHFCLQLFPFLCPQTASAQVRLSEWQTFSSLSVVRSIAQMPDGQIWAGTSGGVYAYNPTTRQVQEFRNIGALVGLNITALRVNASTSQVFAGGANGVVNVYGTRSTQAVTNANASAPTAVPSASAPSASAPRWSAITDILTAASQQKGVSDFAFRDSLVFVVGDFGLTVFNLNRNVFTETVVRVGLLPASAPLRRVVIAGGRVWVAGPSGLASASASLSSFVNPSSWTTYFLPDAPPNTGPNANALAPYQAGVLLGEGRRVWFASGASPNLRLLQDNFSGTVRSLAGVGSEAFAGIETASASAQVVTIATASVVVQSATVPRRAPLVLESRFVNEIMPVSIDGRTQLAIATNDGIAIWDAFTAAAMMNPTTSSATTLTLNSPPTNRFRQIVTDSSGALWCVNGSGNGNANVPNNGPASGVYRLKDGRWRAFNTQTTPALGCRDCNTQHSIYAAPGGSFHAGVWSSSWGASLTNFASVPNPSSASASDSVRIQRYNNTNSTLMGFGTDPEQFIVAGGVAVDPRTETLWISNFTSRFVSARDRQGRFYNMSAPQSALFTCSYANNLLLSVDANGTKWIASPTSSQLWAFNERGTLSDSTDDIWQCVNGLFSGASISAFASDQQGALWVGTQQGVFKMRNPSAVLPQGTGGAGVGVDLGLLGIDKIEDSKIGRLRINAIVVDAVNNKWLATNAGVWVIAANADTVAVQFNAETVPLVNNNVLSLAIDDNTGKAYFGTEDGLSSAQTLALKPENNFSTLRCYPQPFVPSEDGELVIDGLAANSQVKIVMLDGTLVRTLSTTNSRTAVWDGRDTRSQLVQSGIYLVSVFSSADGGSTGVAKVVVIQR